MVPKHDGTCPACQQAFVAQAELPVPRDQSSTGADDPLSRLMSKSRTQCVSRRPHGLTALAVIQFVFASSIAYSFWLLFAGRLQGVGITPYRVLSPLVTIVLLVASGWGYLTRSRLLGYWGGNVLGVSSILNIVVHNALEGFVRLPLHLPSLVYPIVLLCLLQLRYRDAFR